MSTDARPHDAASLRLYDPANTDASCQSAPPAGRGVKTGSVETGYIDGEIAGVVITPITAFTDRRGWLMEVYREDELPGEIHPVMAYISQTEPGVIRGPHEHVDQTDHFVFVGPGDFHLYLWDARLGSSTRGRKMVQLCGQSRPCSVIVPPGVIHGYKNISASPGWVFNAPNRLYAGHGKGEPVDEIRHEDHPESPYRVA